MRVNCSDRDVRLREREREREIKSNRDKGKKGKKEREREREREGGREGEREIYNTLCGSLANTDIGLPGVHSSFTLVSLATDTFSTHNSLNYKKKSSHVTVYECNHTRTHLIIIILSHDTWSHDQAYLERSCEVIETPLQRLPFIKRQLQI